MSQVNTSIEIKDSHKLDEAMTAFRNRHCMERLAPKMLMSGNVLRNKLNADQERHKLTLAESIISASITGDTSILEAGLNMLGYGLHKLEEIESGSTLLHSVFSSIKHSSNVASIYDKSMTDGVLDNAEREEMLKAVNDAERQLKEIRAKLTIKAA